MQHRSSLWTDARLDLHTGFASRYSLNVVVLVLLFLLLSFTFLKSSVNRRITFVSAYIRVQHCTHFPKYSSLLNP